MLNIETPRIFADRIWAAIDEKWGDADACYKAMADLTAARDAAIRTESAELLRVCGEALEAALKDHNTFNSCVLAGIRDRACWCNDAISALAALREAGMLE